MTDLTSSRSFPMMMNQKVKLPVMFLSSSEFTRQVKFSLKVRKQGAILFNIYYN